MLVKEIKNELNKHLYSLKNNFCTKIKASPTKGKTDVLQHSTNFAQALKGKSDVCLKSTSNKPKLKIKATAATYL